jgi:hypothetical protein
MAQQKSFARAVFDGEIKGPAGKVVNEDGRPIHPSGQDFGHTKEGRAVRLHEEGSHISTVIDYQFPLGTKIGESSERLVCLGGIVTKIKCGVIRNVVVASGEPNGTDVTRLGQSISINDTRGLMVETLPEECPISKDTLGKRSLPDFSVCLGCDYSSVDRYAIYS